MLKSLSCMIQGREDVIYNPESNSVEVAVPCRTCAPTQRAQVFYQRTWGKNKNFLDAVTGALGSLEESWHVNGVTKKDEGKGGTTRERCPRPECRALQTDDGWENFRVSMTRFCKETLTVATGKDPQ